MLHPVQGVLIVEGIQTGDGRIWTPGSITWAPLPLPLAWAADGTQHVDIVEVAPEIGNITAIIRQGNVLVWVGVVDDEIPEGAEAVRRMRAGSATNGQRLLVSIDGDDWALEFVLTNPDEMDVLMLASGGEGEQLPTSTQLRTMVAAAGQGDPGGLVLFEDAADEILLRYTRTRIRGATVVATSAFTEAYMELGDEEAVVASIDVARPSPPFPAAWFQDPQLAAPTPLTVGVDGRVSGHVASWESCHVGYEDRCVAPPHSATSYEHAHRRPPIDLDDGSQLRVGSITVATGHAPLTAVAEHAAAHYDDTGACAALVRFGEDEHGIWAAGVVNPTATREQVWALRSSAPSGDWRRIDGSLELVAVLSVNVPGFPVPDSLAASVNGECNALIVNNAPWSRPREASAAAALEEGLITPEVFERTRIALADIAMQRARVAARR